MVFSVEIFAEGLLLRVKDSSGPEPLSGETPYLWSDVNWRFGHPVSSSLSTSILSYRQKYREDRCLLSRFHMDLQVVFPPEYYHNTEVENNDTSGTGLPSFHGRLL